MNITLFSEVTTEQSLLAIKSEAEKYQGLYADMNDPKQRKYVKEKSVALKELDKAVERRRIDAIKAFTLDANSQAKRITDVTGSANEPFTLLIDDYNAERKRELNSEKERKAKE